MSEDVPNIAIIGLPESGKTTLLAAIWHVVREPGSVASLQFDRLSQGNYEHLNSLAKRWRAGKKQLRTQTSGLKTVSMRLKNSLGHVSKVTFPDMPGEEFSRMWEDREIDEDARDSLSASAIVLIVNGDTIKFPAWTADRLNLARAAGLAPEQADIVDWRADLAPTQVQVVELLQLLMCSELDVGPRRLAVLISAWDEVEEDGLDPSEVLATKLPLLNQYLCNGRDPWTWRVWGVSAQGGVYEDEDKGEELEATEALREIERPSERIKVVDGTRFSSDITLPLDWLIE